METYPRHPPLVFVNPTRDMVIKCQHSFVNPYGLVSIPYLQNWVYPGSNLVSIPYLQNWVYKRNAVNKLVENVHSDVVELREMREAEMEAMFNAQAVLWRREEELSKGLREMLD
ncbi:hypothetical protein L1987_32440 [Smallanthus sonchifolius]|uniref:Uncharacterized protein n=1 Tax=Smallanthus sonchifolius TaxID=185202 RepID=A0ACB9HPK4_9ASTR|nr:hypothetical protein L1987_32440 [Smallanthus sonchifolius]